MKTFVALIVFLFSYQLEAACKCTCDMVDSTLCASSYDLDHPCNGTCPSPGPSFPAMRTACPIMQIHNPNTGSNVWITLCRE